MANPLTSTHTRVDDRRQQRLWVPLWHAIEQKHLQSPAPAWSESLSNSKDLDQMFGFVEDLYPLPGVWWVLYNAQEFDKS